MKTKEIECKIPSKRELVLGEDYYFNENNQWVFTAKYHINRGYCCKNGCKHCPYSTAKDYQ